MSTSCTPSPYYPLQLLTNLPVASLNQITPSPGNDLTYIFSTIKIAYIYYNQPYTLSGSVTSPSGGQPGMFFLAVSATSQFARIYHSALLNGVNTSDYDITTPFGAQLFICCGKANGVTAYISIGNTIACDSESSDNPSLAGPYYSTNFSATEGSLLNDNRGNDLSYVFSTIKIIYTSSNCGIGGGAYSAATGQGGMFVLVVNQGTNSITVSPGGFINGNGSATVTVNKYCAQLFIYCGQAADSSGYQFTSYITVGNQQNCSNDGNGPSLTGPYFSTDFSTPIGSSLNGNIGNDLTYVFSAIKIVYTSSNWNIGGYAGDTVAGQAGMFILVVNQATGNITVGAGGFLNGSGGGTVSLSGRYARLFVCCGQVSGYTSWISIGDAKPAPG